MFIDTFLCTKIYLNKPWSSCFILRENLFRTKGLSQCLHCFNLQYDAYISMRLHFSKLWYHLAHVHYPLRHTWIHFSLTPRCSCILPLAFLPCACPFPGTSHCHCAEWQCPNQSGFHLANLNRQPQPDICLMCFCYVGSWLHKSQPARRKQWL